MILLKDEKLGVMLNIKPSCNAEIDLCWNWKSFGFMVFCYPESPDGSKAFSLQLLWPHVIFTIKKRKCT